MKEKLYHFTDELGSFCFPQADKINTLYFPLCNEYPFMSAITPTLHGDIKTDNNSFLLEPTSRISLITSKMSRNFWCYLGPNRFWSATGVSKDYLSIRKDKFSLQAGLLWHKTIRQNKNFGLQAEITSFVPLEDPVEIMLVTIKNISNKDISLVPTAAIPIYARTANNLRDHRHVTSLLNRIKVENFGVTVVPTLLFDESGHKKNITAYFVWGQDEKNNPARYIFPTLDDFCLDSSDLEAPLAVCENKSFATKKLLIEGKEALAGLKFKTLKLAPGRQFTYTLVMGIAKNYNQVPRLWRRYNSLNKCLLALEKNKEFWRKKSEEIQIDSPNPEFNNWFRWVSIQPTLRKIYGCSFLPDFDYGRGGRGWRDLWQDCLCLILTNPDKVRELLLNNFKGVRIDGSNATIIGQKPGEFIADRNNISRMWMDHGIWPLLTCLLYIHQTKDLKILFEKTTYFCDQHLSRCRKINPQWNPQKGNLLRTKKGNVYQGTILEHILVQNLSQFFNVGPHNHIRLEGADWNDGLDMATNYGESVAFTAMYAKNLMDLALLLENLPVEKIKLFEEINLLLNKSHTYNHPWKKTKILNKYFDAVNNYISGKVIELPIKSLIQDLKLKSLWIREHIRKKEWLQEGFYNGYYDEEKKRVEGRVDGRMRMTLTSATFSIMSGIATDAQVKSIWSKAKRFLQDKKLGGFRLNTNFKFEKPTLGRAFFFAYGEKENGAFFNHMSVMFAYALYCRGFVKEGFEVINSIYQMATNTPISKIYPCLPEYFNLEGRGMYSYLTGSASWFVLTLLTQVFGIRGEYGNLVVEPKLLAKQFQKKSKLTVITSFAQKRIKVVFLNPQGKDYPDYHIGRVFVNNQIIKANGGLKRFVLSREQFLALANKELNTIVVNLN